MECPLPIDWLDWLDDPTAAPSLAQHLGVCVSCRTAVAALRRDLAKAPRLRRPVTTAGAVFEAETAAAPAAGDLWVTAAPDAGGDSALVVILDERHEEYGREWHEVAGVGTDVENAIEVDLLLEPIETTVGTALRVRFETQGYLPQSDLRERAGVLTEAGREAVAIALHGTLDEARWGLPVEGPYDPRIAVGDRDAEPLRQLQLLYRTLAAAAEDAELSLARTLVEVRKQRRLTRAQLADRLATALGVAALAAKVKRYYADLENGLLDPAGLSPALITELGRTLAIPRPQIEGLRYGWIPPSAAAPAPAFARAGLAATRLPSARAPEKWDAVDDLFRGEQR